MRLYAAARMLGVLQVYLRVIWIFDVMDIFL